MAPQPRSPLPLLLLAGAVAWQSGLLQPAGFASGGPRAAPVRGPVGNVARRAFAFDVEVSEGHEGLKLVDAEEAGAKQVYTEGKYHYGNWNTVLGSEAIPAKGRSYWEVKIARKPLDSWEYIGVSEGGIDLGKKLVSSQKPGWFWGGNKEDAFSYAWAAPAKEWAESYKKEKMKKAQDTLDAMDATMQWFESPSRVDEKITKAFLSNVEKEVKDHWTGPGKIAGQNMDGTFPRLKQGMVIGVDVDMDKGTIGYWADGKFLGVAKDTYGKPVDLKGKKIFPAVSVYGRLDDYDRQEGTVLELRSGLEPPAL